MTVYVDDMLLPAEVQNGPRTIRGVWTHMVADSETELHEFAVRLGLKRSYCQYRRSGLSGKWNCHYDLTQSKVKKALELGATRVTTQEALQIMGKMTMEMYTWKVGIGSHTALIEAPDAAAAALFYVRSKAVSSNRPDITVVYERDGEIYHGERMPLFFGNVLGDDEMPMPPKEEKLAEKRIDAIVKRLPRCSFVEENDGLSHT